MNIVFLDYKMIKQYKKTIIDYLKDVLCENGIEYSQNNVEKIYNNMCLFSNDGTAIIYGAIDNNSLYGFIWGYRTENNRIHITQFVVSKDYRFQGIGKKLINSMYDYAINNNIQVIELMATVNNENTISFYNKQGFEIERVKMKKELRGNQKDE